MALPLPLELELMNRLSGYVNWRGPHSQHLVLTALSLLSRPPTQPICELWQVKGF